MVLRSRAKWLYEGGEKKTWRFCNFEERNFVQKATCFIQKENDEIIHDSSFITQEAKLFYEKLYVPHENDIVNFGMVI